MRLRFLMETQNFFFVPQHKKHLSLFFTKLKTYKTYNLSYSMYKTKGLLRGWQHHQFKRIVIFSQTKKTWVVISLINWKVSIKVGYQQSTAACKTSYRCCLFSLWAGFHVWVLPHGTATYYTNHCHLWTNLLKLL